MSPQRRRRLLTTVLALTAAIPSALPAIARAPSAPIPASVATDPCTQVDVVNDSCPAWAATYGNDNEATPPNATTDSPDERAQAMLVSADGKRIYTAGISRVQGSGPYGMAIVANDAATGAQLWATRYDVAGKANGPNDLAESPDGATLYVGGAGQRLSGPNSEFLTLGLDAATGAKTLEWRWSPDGSSNSQPVAIGVSPDGKRLVVAGTGWWGSTAGTTDYVAAGYDLVKNELLWDLRRAATPNSGDEMADAVLSPDGSTLYATGYGAGTEDISTIAVDVATGEIRWSDLHDEGIIEMGSRIAVSPDGSRVFVAGTFSTLAPANGLWVSDYGTLAFDAATGGDLWAKRYHGPPQPSGGANYAQGIAVDDRGERVFVTGLSSGTIQNDFDATTVAYDIADGRQAWVARYAFPGHTYESGAGLVYEPEQDRVYMTGVSATVADMENFGGKQGRIIAAGYDAGNGNQVWSARYGLRTDDPKRALDYDAGSFVAVRSDSRRLFVGGTLGHRNADSQAELYDFDFATLAYDLPGAGRAMPDAGGWHSQNLEWVTHVPGSSDSAGLKIVGNWMYITTESHLKIYDITDPLLPVLTGAVANPGDDSPYFPEEDVDTNGKILLMGADVIDVTDKANPRIVGTNSSNNDHTITCVLDCTWAYTSGGRIIDLRVPTAPTQTGLWTTGMPATSNRHDVTEVAPGIIVTSSSPLLLLDAREDPSKPKLLAKGPTESGQFNHGNDWPNLATDKFLMVGGETGSATTNCSSDKSAVMRTFDATNWQATGALPLIDKYTPPNGLYTNGQSPADTYCAHWSDTHPTYRNGGLVAMAWYEHGTRLLRITPQGKIREVGFFIPYGGTTSATYWVNDTILYEVDYNRGLDILRYTGRP